MAGNNNKQDLYQVAIDISDAVKSLQQLVTAYQDVQGKLQQALRVSIDTQSIKDLAQQIGVQFDGVGKGIVAAIAQTTGQVNDTLKQIEIQTASTTSMMADQFELVAKTASNTGKVVGKSILSAYSAGKQAAQAAQQANQQAQASVTQLGQGLTLTQQQTDRLVATFNQLRSAASRLSEDQLATALGTEGSRVGRPLKLNQPADLLAVDTENKTEYADPIKIGAISRALRENISAVKDQDSAVNKLDADAARAENRLLAQADAMEKGFQRDTTQILNLGERSRIAYNQLIDSLSKLKQTPQVQALADQLQAGGGGAGAPNQFFDEANGRFNKEAVDSYKRAVQQLADQEKQEASAAKVADKAHLEAQAQILGISKEQLAVHKGIGAELADTAGRMLKWLVFYRLVRDTMRQIEMSVSNFVSMGVEYTKQTEDQTMKLTGILAANYDLVDAQGQQVTGAEKITAIQKLALGQQQQLAESAKGTAATTEDMVGIYDQITPRLASIGKTTADVQNLTKLTAAAAQVMGISYKEAGSQLATLLSGKGANSALGKALYPDSNAFKNLANQGTSAIFGDLQARLQPFMQALQNAQPMLSTVITRFRELIAAVSSKVEAPILDMFKQFFGSLDSHQDSIELFYESLQRAFASVGQTLKEVMGDLSSDGSAGFSTLTDGVAAFVSQAIRLAGVLVEATKDVAQFVAENRGLIEVLAAAIALFSGVGVITNWGREVLSALLSYKQFIQKAIAAKAAQAALSGEFDTAATKLSLADKATAAFGSSLKAFVVGGFVTAVAAGLGLIAEKLIQIWTEAQNANRAMEDLRVKGDIIGGDLEAQKNLTSSDPSRQAEAMQHFAESVAALNTRFQEYGTTVDTVADKIIQLREEQAKLEADARSATDPLARKDLVNQAVGHARAIQDLTDLLHHAQAMQDYVRQFQNIQAANAQQLTDAQRKAAGGAIAGDEFGLAQAALQKRVDSLKATNQAYAGQAKNLQDISDFARKASLALEELDIKGQKLASDALKGNKINPPAPGKFTTGYYDSAIKQLQDQTAISNSDLDVAAKSGAMSAEEAGQQKLENDAKLLAAEKQIREQELQDLANFHAQHAIKDEQFVADQERVKAQLADIEKNYHIAANQYASAEIDREQKFADTLKQLQGQTAQREAQAFGQREQSEQQHTDRLAIEWAQRFQAMKLNAQQQEQVQAALNAFIKAGDDVSDQRKFDTTIKIITRDLSTLSAAQKALDQAFAQGQVSINGYVQQTASLQSRRAALLNQEMLATQAQIARLGDKNPEQVDQLKDKLIELQNQLDSMNVSAQQVLSTFARLGGEVGTIFSGFSVTGDPLALVAAAAQLRRIQRSMQAITQLAPTFRSAIAGAKLLFGGNGVGEDLSSVAIKQQPASLDVVNGLPNVNLPSTQYNGLLDPNTFTAVGNAAEGAGTKIVNFFKKVGGASNPSQAGIGSAIMGMATSFAFGATAIIGIASALFQKAVQAAKDDMTKSIQGINDAIKSGTDTLGQGMAQLKSAREQAVHEYSGSKAGRQALSDMLPQFDQQIQQVSDQMAQVAQTFKDALQQASLGTGPRADVENMVLDLNKKAADYINALDPSSPTFQADLAQRKQDIQQLFDDSMRAEKETLEENMQGYEQTAIDAQSKLFDLLDQQKSLQQQLADLDNQRLDLQKQQAQIDQDRIKAAQNIKQLETDIANILQKAADDEAAVRRKGVLDAQLTVAEQKAYDIQTIRNQSLTDLQSKQSDLATAQTDTSIDDRQKALNLQVQQLQDQHAQTLEAISLNNIQISGQKAMVALESQLFGISSSRTDLEQRSMGLQLANAKVQLDKWQQTKQMIDAIVTTGDHVIFNAPPGFPQVKLYIDTITIDNSDHSSTTVDVNQTGPGALGPGVNPGGPQANGGVRTPKQASIDRRRGYGLGLN